MTRNTALQKKSSETERSCEDSVPQCNGARALLLSPSVTSAGRFPAHQAGFLYPNLATVEVQKEHLKNFSLRWCSWDLIHTKGIKVWQGSDSLEASLEAGCFPLPNAVWDH